MTREEFEIKYAMKYMELSFTHNPTECKQSIESLRDGNGYTDHHIDLCWKVQMAKNIGRPASLVDYIDDLEW